MLCEVCNNPIPQERLDALEGVSTCAKCSTVKRVVGYMVYAEKTNPTLVVLNPEDRDAINLADRANRRSR